ncbi:hypothetical protein [Streptomyces sp. NPDC048581]|uniref:hypothetical protein n=1 Tax=unclassified Streptomyces TaxID=2593676 RepID=UPI003719F02E
MSDDYAALITTVILAVLLIGTVQLYTLIKSYSDALPQADASHAALLERAVQAVHGNRDPSAEDLVALDQYFADMLAHMGGARRRWGIYLASGAWMTICCVLVITQIEVLKWSATHTPGQDAPQLAKSAFYIASWAIMILVFEGFVRVIIQMIANLQRRRARFRQFSADDLRRLSRAAQERYRQAQQPNASGTSDPDTP